MDDKGRVRVLTMLLTGLLFSVLALAMAGSRPAAAQFGIMVPAIGEFVRNGGFDYYSSSGIPYAWWVDISPGYPTAVVSDPDDSTNPVLRIQPPILDKAYLFIWQEIHLPDDPGTPTLSLRYKLLPFGSSLPSGRARVRVQFETDTGTLLESLTSQWYDNTTGWPQNWVTDTTDLSSIPGLIDKFKQAYQNGERVRLVVGYERDNTNDDILMLVDDISFWTWDGQRFQPFLGGAIAFIGKNSSGQYTVEWIYPDGSDRTTVWTYPSSTTVKLWKPAWRPDGREIAFASGHESSASPYLTDIYAVRPDGSGLRRITNPPAMSEVQSGYQYGTVTGRLYNNYGTVTAMNLYVMGAKTPVPFNPGARGDTTTFTILNVADLGPGEDQPLVITWGDGTCATGVEWEVGTTIDVQPGQTIDIGTITFDGDCNKFEASTPTWKWDGTEVGFSGAGLARRANANGEFLGRPLFNTGIIGNDLDWSPADTLPDREQVLFQGQANGAFGIHLTTEGSSSATTLVNDSQFLGAITGEQAWLPDGSTFVYSTSDGQIYEYDPNNTSSPGKKLLALNNEIVEGLSVSPDGDYIVFERIMGPKRELWILYRKSPNVLWPLVTDFATDPDWGKSAPVFPTPSISIKDVTVTEGDTGTTDATFTVSLSEAIGRQVTVDYATADGTATASQDYTATSGTLTFNAGETSKTITVPVIGDTTTESNETFYVNLTNPSNATIADGQGVGTIQDDDSPSSPSQPQISINDVTVTEGNTGTTNATFTVSLSQASSAQVTVDYATADGTATAGSDYQSTSGTLTFNAGETSKTITVPVYGDTTAESNETFYVNLTNPSNATIADGQGVGTIQDDDGSSGSGSGGSSGGGGGGSGGGSTTPSGSKIYLPVVVK